MNAKTIRCIISYRPTRILSIYGQKATDSLTIQVYEQSFIWKNRRNNLRQVYKEKHELLSVSNRPNICKSKPDHPIRFSGRSSGAHEFGIFGRHSRSDVANTDNRSIAIQVFLLDLMLGHVCSYTCSRRVGNI